MAASTGKKYIYLFIDQLEAQRFKFTYVVNLSEKRLERYFFV